MENEEEIENLEESYNDINFKNVSKDNIINHYNQSNEDEKRLGKDWYKDAHLTTKLLAKEYNIPHHAMTGLVSIYSPQMDWSKNFHTAANVARTKIPVGGPGEGVMTSSKQKEIAKKILEGEHYTNLIKGNKIRAFGHLIQHGGNKNPNDPQVCVDRHALSVACGKRLTDKELNEINIKSKSGYNKVSKAYIDASKHLKNTKNIDIQPHELQATTWLTRQRLNHNENNNMFKNINFEKKANTFEKKWSDYLDEFHPRLEKSKIPGTGYNKVTKNLIESKLNNLSPRELKQKLKDNGWKPKEDRSGGNHELYSHPEYKNTLAIPRHAGFIRTGTLRTILKNAGIKENILNKAKYIMKEGEEKKKAGKISLNKNKTNIKIFPPLKEMLNEKVFTSKELMRAVYFPEGIINDPNASSELKNYAFNILQLRNGNN